MNEDRSMPNSHCEQRGEHSQRQPAADLVQDSWNEPIDYSNLPMSEPSRNYSLSSMFLLVTITATFCGWLSLYFSNLNSPSVNGAGSFVSLLVILGVTVGGITGALQTPRRRITYFLLGVPVGGAVGFVAGISTLVQREDAPKYLIILLFGAVILLAVGFVCRAKE